MSIDVTMVTWPNHPCRLEYFQRTHAALKQYLTGPELRFLASAESERDPESHWQGDALAEYCDREGIALHWHEGPASLGGNMNSALRICTADVIFLVQDDWMLLAPLDLTEGASMLRRHPDVDLIRYSYCERENNKGTQFTGKTLDGFRQVNIRGNWPYGDDPQLRTPRTTDRHGWYLERGHLAEANMIHRLVKANASIYAADRNYFSHYGGYSAVPDAKELRPNMRKRNP